MSSGYCLEHGYVEIFCDEIILGDGKIITLKKNGKIICFMSKHQNRIVDGKELLSTVPDTIQEKPTKKNFYCDICKRTELRTDDGLPQYCGFCDSRMEREITEKSRDQPKERDMVCPNCKAFVSRSNEHYVEAYTPLETEGWKCESKDKEE